MPNLDLDPITRKEQFLSRAAGGVGLDLEPVTREEHFLKAIADSGGGGGGGSVTPESVLAATGQMSNEQAGQTLGNLRGLSTDVVSIPTALEDGRFLKASNDGTASWEPLVHVATPSSATVSLEPADGWCYNCGTLTSLTISNPPATGAYSIVFTSGATPTVTTFPETILGLEDFAAEANTLYEINVLDNRALVGSWAVSV